MVDAANFISGYVWEKKMLSGKSGLLVVSVPNILWVFPVESMFGYHNPPFRSSRLVGQKRERVVSSMALCSVGIYCCILVHVRQTDASCTHT